MLNTIALVVVLVLAAAIAAVQYRGDRAAEKRIEDRANRPDDPWCDPE